MAKKSTSGPKKENTQQADNTEKWLPWVLAALGFVLYSTGFSNEMVGMDDHTATVDNPAVKDFLIFNGFNLGMYAPLTWIGYQIAYILGKESPNWYHMLSALVHFANVLLVFRLFRKLDFNLAVSAVVALFFAIHPLQVEAVAWIAGFSTPLFSMFSLLAMNYYLKHTSEEGSGWGKNYWLAVTMFLLACLAKSAAVTLPLTLLVLDLWKKRGLNTKIILEKAPFFAISLAFGALTLYSRQYAGRPCFLAPGKAGLLCRYSGLALCFISLTLFWPCPGLPSVRLSCARTVITIWPDSAFLSCWPPCLIF